MQENLRTIINKLIENDIEWIKSKDIKVGDKGDYWILNYGIQDKNEYNSLVRGLIVEKPTYNYKDPLNLIKSFPFTRFFNQGEKEAEYINMNNADMLEKLDGCMVGVFFPNKDYKNPSWHTRKMISCHKDDMSIVVGGFGGNQQYELMKIIGEYVKKLSFDNNDINYTFIFEFIHFSSTVITKYNKDQYGLYLLSARNLNNYQELSEEELDIISKRIESKRPNRWNSISDQNIILEIIKKMCDEIQDFEGVVFRDKQTGKRIKLKDANYVEKHRFLGEISYKRLVPQVLDGESDEIASYFPQAKKLIDEIKIKHQNIKLKIIETIKSFNCYRNLSRKELWENVDKKVEVQFIKSLIMKHLNTQDLDVVVEDELRKISVSSFEKETYAGKQKFKVATIKYLNLLGLKDDEINDI